MESTRALGGLVREKSRMRVKIVGGLSSGMAIDIKDMYGQEEPDDKHNGSHENDACFNDGYQEELYDQLTELADLMGKMTLQDTVESLIMKMSNLSVEDLSYPHSPSFFPSSSSSSFSSSSSSSIFSEASVVSSTISVEVDMTDVPLPSPSPISPLRVAPIPTHRRAPPTTIDRPASKSLRRVLRWIPAIIRSSTRRVHKAAYRAVASSSSPPVQQLVGPSSPLPQLASPPPSPVVLPLSAQSEEAVVQAERDVKGFETPAFELLLPAQLEQPIVHAEHDAGHSNTSVPHAPATPVETVKDIGELWKHGVLAELEEVQPVPRRALSKKLREKRKSEFASLPGFNPAVFELLVGMQLQRGRNPRDMMDANLASKLGDKWAVDYARIDSMVALKGFVGNSQVSYYDPETEHGSNAIGNNKELFETMYQKIMDGHQWLMDEVVCEWAQSSEKNLETLRHIIRRAGWTPRDVADNKSQ